MPSIKDMKQNINWDDYEPVPAAPPSPPPNFQADQSLAPVRDPLLRFSAPFLPNTFPSSDTLRGYRIGNQIPQWRIPVPAPASAQGAGTSVTKIIATESASSAASRKSVLGIIQKSSMNVPTLNPGDRYTGTASMIGESWVFFSLASTFLMRVRGYSTASAQTIDLTRPITQAPGLGTQEGLIFDVVMDTTPEWSFSPQLVGCNQVEGESQLLFLSVDNLSNASTNGSVSVEYAPIAGFKDQI